METPSILPAILIFFLNYFLYSYHIGKISKYLSVNLIIYRMNCFHLTDSLLFCLQQRESAQKGVQIRTAGADTRSIVVDYRRVCVKWTSGVPFGTRF